MERESWEKRIMSPVCETAICRGVGEVLSQCAGLQMFTSVGSIGVILEDCSSTVF